MYRHRRRNQVVAVVLALIASAIGGVLISSQGLSDTTSSTAAAQQVLNHPVFGQMFWLIVIAGLLGLAAAVLFSGNDRNR